MHRTRKKGFTIVELVIVIAVIAILAAVLIPTFASLIDKANLSSDIQAVRQMNMVLAAESAFEKPADFDAVCGILGDAGYDDQKGMRPVSENHRFFWHSDQNEIFLAKIIDDEQVATVVFPEYHEVLTFADYKNYKDLLGQKVFDLAYPGIGYESIDIAVTGVSLSQTTLTLNVGDRPTLTATVEPDNATNKTVKWDTDDPDIATVTKSGRVTAVGVGTTKITATVDGTEYTAVCIVTVTAEISTADDLVKALESGGDIKLNASANITLEEHIEINNTTVLDLNGATLRINSNDTNDSGMDVNNGVTLTIVNNGGASGSLEIVGDDGYGGIYVAQGGTLILDGVTINHPDKMCLQNVGTITMKNNCAINSTNAWWPYTIANGTSKDGTPIRGTLNISNTTITAVPTTASGDGYNNGNPMSSDPVIWNRAGSTVNFGANVTITGELLNDYDPVFYNEDGGIVTGSVTVNGVTKTYS